MLSVAESHLEPEREERGNHLILVHCAAVGRERPSAYSRLVGKVGNELARLLMFALTGSHGRRGSSSP
ncbi:MAG: hypothetical protein ACTHKS_05780 [Gaiellaceae bacterium]